MRGILEYLNIQQGYMLDYRMVFVAFLYVDVVSPKRSREFRYSSVPEAVFMLL